MKNAAWWDSSEAAKAKLLLTLLLPLLLLQLLLPLLSLPLPLLLPPLPPPLLPPPFPNPKSVLKSHPSSAMEKKSDGLLLYCAGVRMDWSKAALAALPLLTPLPPLLTPLPPPILTPPPLDADGTVGARIGSSPPASRELFRCK